MAEKKRPEKKPTTRRGSHITSTVEVSRPTSIRETPRVRPFTRDDFMAALMRVSGPRQPEKGS